MKSVGFVKQRAWEPYKDSSIKNQAIEEGAIERF